MTKNNGIKQFIKFGIVGFSNTIISYLIYVGGLSLLQRYSLFSQYDYMICSVIAFALSVLWSFFWNNRYTFQKKEGEERNLFSALLKTYVSYSFTGLFLSNVLLYIQVNNIGISKVIAPIINLIVTVPLNFVMNKYWAFKR